MRVDALSPLPYSRSHFLVQNAKRRGRGRGGLLDLALGLPPASSFDVQYNAGTSERILVFVCPFCRFPSTVVWG